MQNLQKFKRKIKLPSDILSVLTHIVMLVKIPREAFRQKHSNLPERHPQRCSHCGGKCWLPFRTVALVPLRALQMTHLPIGKWQLLFNPEPCHLHALVSVFQFLIFSVSERKTLLTNNCSSYHVTTSMAHVPLMTWKRDSPAFLTWSSKACVDVRLFEEFMLLFRSPVYFHFACSHHACTRTRAKKKPSTINITQHFHVHDLRRLVLPHLRERQSTTSVPASAPSQSGIFSSMNFHIKPLLLLLLPLVVHKSCPHTICQLGDTFLLLSPPPHRSRSGALHFSSTFNRNSLPVSASVGGSTLLCLTHLDYLNSVSHDSKLVTFFTSCMSSSSAAMNPATNLRLLHYVPQNTMVCQVQSALNLQARKIRRCVLLNSMHVLHPFGVSAIPKVTCTRLVTST